MINLLIKYFIKKFINAMPAKKTDNINFLKNISEHVKFQKMFHEQMIFRWLEYRGIEEMPKRYEN